MHLQQKLYPIKSCHSKPVAPQRAQRRKPPRAYSSNSSYHAGSGPSENQPQDLVGGMLDFCILTCTRVTETAVSRIADVVQSIAPPDAPRHKIEVSVKGALCLLVLGLLKGVLNFVLLVGSIGLAVYTASQVFGWNAVVLGQGTFSGTAQQRHQQQQYHRHQQQQQQYTPGTGQAAAAAAAASGGGYQAGQAYPRWQQHQQGQWNAWPMQEQSDVVEVTRGAPS